MPHLVAKEHVEIGEKTIEISLQYSKEYIQQYSYYSGKIYSPQKSSRDLGEVSLPFTGTLRISWN